MRIITYNVEYCEDINRSWKYLEIYKYLKIVKNALLEMIEHLRKANPDILGLIEIDSGSVRFGRKSGAEFFAEKLGIDYWIEKTKYARKSVFKVLNFMPIVRKQANAVLSKYKLSDTKFYFLSKGITRLVIHTVVEVPFCEDMLKLNLFAVHLSIRKKTRAKQLKELGYIVRACPSPKIVLGDFNTFKGFEELEEFLGVSGLRDACNGDFSVKTFPSWKPKRRLDHIFVSSDIKVNNYQVLDIKLSDHLPLLVDFEIVKPTFQKYTDAWTPKAYPHL